MTKNQVKQQKEETTNVECSKYVIEDFPENISDRNIFTDKSIKVSEDLHREDKYEILF